jgi:chromate transporter
LAAITAAVVGVIANLALWFGLRVLFRRFDTLSIAGARHQLPDLASVDLVALALTAVAAVLLLRLHLGVVRTLATVVFLSLLSHVVLSVV